VADDVADVLACTGWFQISENPFLSCATLPSRLGLSAFLSPRNRKVEGSTPKAGFGARRVQ
jgi:hypothetical protein